MGFTEAYKYFEIDPNDFIKVIPTEEYYTCSNAKIRINAITRALEQALQKFYKLVDKDETKVYQIIDIDNAEAVNKLYNDYIKHLEFANHYHKTMLHMSTALLENAPTLFVGGVEKFKIDDNFERIYDEKIKDLEIAYEHYLATLHYYNEEMRKVK